MKKNILFLLIPLLLSGCNLPTQEDVTPIPHQDDEGESEGEQTPSEGEGEGSEGEGDVNPPDEGGDEEEDPPHEDPPPTPPTPVTTIKTIKEIKELCNKLTPATDDIKITTSEIEVEFVGQAIDSIDTKANSANHTPQMKVLVADETGYIFVASQPGSQSQNTLYQSFSNNKQKHNSKYIIKGKIGLYRGQPEVVCESFTWDEKLEVTYDLDKLSTSYIDSIPSFYNVVNNEADYNAKGQGIGYIHKMEDLKCIGKADNNSWIFTDSTKKIMGVYDFISNTTFTVGSVYDITGLTSTNQWKPSLRVLDYKLKSDVSVDDPYESYKDITIKETFNIKRPKLDDKDYRRYPDYLSSFQYVYKSTVYFDYINNSSNEEICGDQYYSTSPSSNQVAASRYYARFNNDNYDWPNIDDSYFTDNKTVTIFYSLYQQDQVTYNKVTYMQWKIYMFKDPTILN